MKNRRGILLMLVGVVLILGAGGLLLHNNWQEKNSKEFVSRVIDEFERLVDPFKRETMQLPKQMQSVVIDGKEYIGSLDFPTLDQSFPILKNCNDELLKLAPCRYTGSYLKDNMIIAGHNYSSGFGLIKRLEIGDKVFFTDTLGNTLTYKVKDVQEIDGMDIKGMKEKGEWDLTLFTCTYGGQSRYAVRCVKTNEERENIKKVSG